MFADFLTGAMYVTKGCRDFFQDRKAWKFAVIPLVIMTGVYFCFFRLILHFSGKAADCVNAMLPKLPAWLGWLSSIITGLSYIAGITAALFLLGATVCTAYEMFGGLFFDSLVEYYEKKEYGRTPCRHTLRENMKTILDSLFFGIYTSIVFLLLMFMSFFFPLIGQILMIFAMGYYMGVSYMICAAYNKGIPLSEMRRAADKKRNLVLGFGITAYILLLIPFATILLLPGLVLGGTKLFNDKLKEST